VHIGTPASRLRLYALAFRLCVVCVIRWFTSRDALTSCTKRGMIQSPIFDGKPIALLILAGVAGLLMAYAVRVARIGRIAAARLDTVRGTVLLGRYPIEAFHWAARAVGRALSRVGVSPDLLTFLSPALTLLTVPFAAAGYFEAAGAILIIGSSLDALDGIVARELGMTSDAGEVLDSVMDRYSDTFALAGLGLFYRDSAASLAIVLLALLGSMMVSYVRAKTDKFGIPLPSTLMRRPERIAYLSGAMLLGPTLSAWVLPDYPKSPLTLATLALVAVVANVAALQLLVCARQELRRRSELPR
jgi:CDP-diacylglycerol---glycerol-3-phosphate 3-phosphatidyltransferase